MSLSICTLFISYSRKQRMRCLALFCRLSVLLIGFTQLDTTAFTKEHVSEYIYLACVSSETHTFLSSSAIMTLLWNRYVAVVETDVYMT